MPLELQPMTIADIPSFVAIQGSTFSGGIISKIIPQPATPENNALQIEKALHSFNTERDLHWLKVVDTELGGTMIAGAKWRINERERTEEEWRNMLPVIEEGEQNEAKKDFLGYLNEARRKWMGGRPFYFLHLLVTHPDHQRRGAGAMMVRWGIEKADRAQLPAFLEASEAGKPLYARLGFKTVHEQKFDLSKYGGEGVDTSTLMIRDPVPV